MSLFDGGRHPQRFRLTTRLRSLTVKWIRFHLKSFHKLKSSSSFVRNLLPTEIDLTTINMSQTTPNSQKQVVQHTNAINLARRWSVQNENDLLQVRLRYVWGLRSEDRSSIRCLLFRVNVGHFDPCLHYLFDSPCLVLCALLIANRKICFVSYILDLVNALSKERWNQKIHSDTLLLRNLCSIFAADSNNIGMPEYSHKMCQEMASHMVHVKNLPEGCKKYKDVMSDLQRRDSDTTHPTQFLS